jgi:hypothetical protein
MVVADHPRAQNISVAVSTTRRRDAFALSARTADVYSRATGQSLDRIR